MNKRPMQQAVPKSNAAPIIGLKKIQEKPRVKQNIIVPQTNEKITAQTKAPEARNIPTRGMNFKASTKGIKRRM